MAARLEGSRRFASAFQFALILLSCGAAAVFCAIEVGQVLGRPMIAAEAAMAGGRAARPH